MMTRRPSGRRPTRHSVVVLAASLLLVGSTACTPDEGQTEPRSVNVSRDSMGKEWPLDVQRGALRCVGASEVVFTAPNGLEYAVNGSAMSTRKYVNIRKIWSDSTALGGTKKDIGPLIDLGLSLCPR
ncbi:DUF2511 domain-containing protein [Nocardioides renjunii]|uniref:DUF2511 domain-containing protein n=1 Tax=Nocardioides renjunii TaxID=3095075 RepID=UPI0038620A96